MIIRKLSFVLTMFLTILGCTEIELKKKEINIDDFTEFQKLYPTYKKAKGLNPFTYRLDNFFKNGRLYESLVFDSNKVELLHLTGH